MAKHKFKIHRFTHKPDKVDGVEFDGSIECARALYNEGWVDNIDTGLTRDNQGPTTLCKVNTVQGQVTVFPGDWVIQQEDGERYGIHPKVLEERYDKAKGDVGNVTYDDPKQADPFVEGFQEPELPVEEDEEEHEPLDGIYRNEQGEPIDPETGETLETPETEAPLTVEDVEEDDEELDEEAEDEEGEDDAEEFDEEEDDEELEGEED